jgi:hypothetical protein
VGGPDEGGGESSVLKKARLLAKQPETIPVFLKQAKNAWLFDGHYRAQGVVEDRAYIDCNQRKPNRSDVAQVLLMEPVEVAHDTYLLTWNPRNSPWDDRERMVGLTAEGRPVEDQWSCGNTKRIRPGDRLFLLRQGQEPRGVMAAGWATSVIYEGPHWDEARRDRGRHRAAGGPAVREDLEPRGR